MQLGRLMAEWSARRDHQHRAVTDSRQHSSGPVTFAGVDDLLLVAQVAYDEARALVGAAAHVKHGHAPLAAVQQLPHQVLAQEPGPARDQARGLLPPLPREHHRSAGSCADRSAAAGSVEGWRSGFSGFSLLVLAGDLEELLR